MNKFTFTDLELLDNIQKIYAEDYIKNMENTKQGIKNTRFYIPIDCCKIAKKMNVNDEIIFNRLYFHLNNKYSYNDRKGNPVYFFAFEVEGLKHCINYAYMCSVLSDLRDNNKKYLISFGLSIAAFVCSIISIIISLIK